MATPSAAWVRVFPGARVPDVLAYVSSTWQWLVATYANAVNYGKSEPELTDNLCEELNDWNRRYTHGMNCDFQAETWEMRRDANGNVTRIARADIRVTLGGELGMPQFVMEFKKLDGTGAARWPYCFDGLNRFVEGKYSVDHEFGAMCGFTCVDPLVEAQDMATYVNTPAYVTRLNSRLNAAGSASTLPSVHDPISAHFDTCHDRPVANSTTPITLLHMMLPCPQPVLPSVPGKTPVKARKPRKSRQGKPPK